MRILPACVAVLIFGCLIQPSGNAADSVIASPGKTAGFAVGDSYTFRATDLSTKRELNHWTETVTSISDSKITFNNGALILDPHGNDIKSSNPNVVSPTHFLPDQYVIGEKWTTRYRVRNALTGASDEAEVHLKVVGKEKITVPAGTFEAFKIVGQGFTQNDGAARNHVLWVAPEFSPRPVASEAVLLGRTGNYVLNQRVELVALKKSVAGH